MSEENQAEISTPGDMAQLMRAFLEDRQRMERALEEERRRRDEEHGRHVEALEEQMRQMRWMFEEGRDREPWERHAAAVAVDVLRLTKLTEADDIETYLTIFERTMQEYEIEPNRWALKLAPQLTGKAQQAYAAMEQTAAMKYEEVKAAILRRYEINEETYRQRFRTATRKSTERGRELVVRLQDSAKKWTKGCKDKDEVVDLIVLEQFLTTLSPQACTWIKERKPATSMEAGQLADDFELARRQTVEHKKSGERPHTGPRRCHTCGGIGHFARDCKKGKDEEEVVKKDGTRRPEVKCYNCQQKGHISTRCPNNAALLCQPTVQNRLGKGVACCGSVEGKAVTDILLDTGCSKTLVRKNLILDNKLLEGDAVTIRCAHGDTVLYPLAEVEMEVEGVPIKVEAAISETLPVGVLLGTDIPELGNLLEKRNIHTGGMSQAEALVVTTRAQALRNRREEAVQQQKEEKLRAKVHPVAVDNATTESGLNSVEIPVIGKEFAEDIFSQGKARAKLSRQQKRENSLQYTKDGTASEIEEAPIQVLDISTQELKKLQASDKTLEAANKAADEGANLVAGRGFFRREGLLYRRWTPRSIRGEEQVVEQLVLPKACRDQVFNIAHSIPLAGHLGRGKTAKRILQRFYWPTLFRDVAQYCRSCPECQKACSQGVSRVPMIPLPIVGVPFERMAMDIVGPLPRSRAGHRYILVICDYATRYPDAIPLKSIDAEHIAEELVKVFSRVGIPQEILTDQGSNFTSQLLSEIYRLLHVHPIRTSPYHPQTDGLVERFNKTLKSMLRKASADIGKDWDKLLPYLLFAYREVPHESTGFSPFELLYGRSVRGPLDVIKETWVASKRSTESVISHVLAMREKLTRMTELVHDNLTNAQHRQKKFYDQQAKERELKQGDQVLVLLPATSNKLLATWQGPYEVLKRTGKVNYIVDMHDTRKRKRTFHINMLKKWQIPNVSSYFADDVSIDVERAQGWKEENQKAKLTIGKHLREKERNDIQELLSKFGSVISSRPGCTQLAMHYINSESAQPVKLPPYHIPHAYREAVSKELKEMLEAGIIEKSRSEWASPIVVVPKKSGEIRLCVDYRRLNSVTRGDAYPMPRIDDLIDSIGGAKFITTIDLNRGYWQVPVAEQDRSKTAFTTPQGLFQFTVMPFGLSGAPATFQRMMDTLIDGLESFTAAYLDDLVIYSETWEDHLEHIQQVFQRLTANNLTAKLAKCQFGMQQCRYLGHVVGNGQVQPEESKLQAVECYTIPSTKKQVRAFLGLTGYYRRFIPDYATVVTPLTDLTKKTAPNH